MLGRLRMLNPDLDIRSVYDKSFIPYGNIVEGQVEDAISFATRNAIPPSVGSQYLPSVEKLETLPSIIDLANKVYGHLDIQAGTVCGQNSVLSGIEYHQGSETIIAVKDFVLIVGHRYEMVGDTYDLKLAKAFFVPAGTIVECFSTTLHYTPCQVDKEGFVTICMLLKGTGDTLENGPEGILKRKNKWFIAHPDNLEKVKAGDFPGCLGKAIEIKID